MNTPSTSPAESFAAMPGSGALSKLIHPGSFPASSKLGGTTIGTNDPAIWQHLLWFDGTVWAAELKSDVLRHVSTLEELRSHFDRWQGSGQSPWRRVCLPNAEICGDAGTALQPKDKTL